MRNICNGDSMIDVNFSTPTPMNIDGPLTAFIYDENNNTEYYLYSRSMLNLSGEGLFNHQRRTYAGHGCTSLAFAFCIDTTTNNTRTYVVNVRQGLWEVPGPQCSYARQEVTITPNGKDSCIFVVCVKMDPTNYNYGLNVFLTSSEDEIVPRARMSVYVYGEEPKYGGVDVTQILGQTPSSEDDIKDKIITNDITIGNIRNDNLSEFKQSV